MPPGHNKLPRAPAAPQTNLHTPRAVRSDTPLGRVLLAVEVPDCDCPLDLSCPCGQGCDPASHDTCPDCLREAGRPADAVAALDARHPPCGHHCPHCSGECGCAPALYQPPCLHVRAAGHRFTLAEWASLQRDFDGPGFDGPPEPNASAVALTREARLALYEGRAAAGVGLYHPCDTLDGAAVGARAAPGSHRGNDRGAGVLRLRGAREEAPAGLPSLDDSGGVLPLRRAA